MIEIREATIDDADAIATVHIDGWRVGYRGIVPDDYLDAEEFATARRNMWQAWSWSSMPWSRLFVVSVHDRVVGFSHTGRERLDHSVDAADISLRGEVYGFYLHPTAWGSGGAGALMSRCEEFLRDEGYSSAVLWVLRDNPRARAFYEKVGWSFTGKETDFTPSDSPDST
ncbi:MAG TPA: GNAT family N-acetyltransferase, partial [Ilumatobacteraceae bacterium]|nr:GNAT family N-acetyltransferase [Ilumatobacteraceae bacterium]